MASRMILRSCASPPIAALLYGSVRLAAAVAAVSTLAPDGAGGRCSSVLDNGWKLCIHCDGDVTMCKVCTGQWPMPKMCPLQTNGNHMTLSPLILACNTLRPPLRVACC